MSDVKEVEEFWKQYTKGAPVPMAAAQLAKTEALKAIKQMSKSQRVKMAKVYKKMKTGTATEKETTEWASLLKSSQDQGVGIMTVMFTGAALVGAAALIGGHVVGEHEFHKALFPEMEFLKRGAEGFSLTKPKFGLVEDRGHLVKYAAGNVKGMTLDAIRNRFGGHEIVKNPTTAEVARDMQASGSPYRMEAGTQAQQVRAGDYMRSPVKLRRRRNAPAATTPQQRRAEEGTLPEAHRKYSQRDPDITREHSYETLGISWAYNLFSWADTFKTATKNFIAGKSYSWVEALAISAGASETGAMVAGGLAFVVTGILAGAVLKEVTDVAGITDSIYEKVSSIWKGDSGLLSNISDNERKAFDADIESAFMGQDDEKNAGKSFQNSDGADTGIEGQPGNAIDTNETDGVSIGGAVGAALTSAGIHIMSGVIGGIGAAAAAGQQPDQMIVHGQQGPSRGQVLAGAAGVGALTGAAAYMGFGGGDRNGNDPPDDDSTPDDSKKDDVVLDDSKKDDKLDETPPRSKKNGLEEFDTQLGVPSTATGSDEQTARAAEMNTEKGGDLAEGFRAEMSGNHIPDDAIYPECIERIFGSMLNYTAFRQQWRENNTMPKLNGQQSFIKARTLLEQYNPELRIGKPFVTPHAQESELQKQHEEIRVIIAGYNYVENERAADKPASGGGGTAAAVGGGGSEGSNAGVTHNKNGIKQTPGTNEAVASQGSTQNSNPEHGDGTNPQGEGQPLYAHDDGVNSHRHSTYNRKRARVVDQTAGERNQVPQFDPAQPSAMKMHRTFEAPLVHPDNVGNSGAPVVYVPPVPIRYNFGHVLPVNHTLVRL